MPVRAILPASVMEFRTRRRRVRQDKKFLSMPSTPSEVSSLGCLPVVLELNCVVETRNLQETIPTLATTYDGESLIRRCLLISPTH